MIIDHDIHLHTHLSRCGKDDATVQNYVNQASRFGLKLLGFTDHLWDDSYTGSESIYEGANTAVPFYRGQNVPHVLSLRQEIAAVEQPGIRILLGAEVEYDPWRHDLAITEANAEQFDYLIFPNSHTHMVMPKSYYEDKRKHIDFMMMAFMDIMKSPLRKYLVTMAHPFCAVACPYGYEEMLGIITDDEYRRCYDACADNGIAVEINLSKFRKYSVGQILESNNLRQFRIAKECGCQFTFGSDSHTMWHQEDFHNFYVVAGAIDLTAEDLSPFVRS